MEYFFVGYLLILGILLAGFVILFFYIIYIYLNRDKRRLDGEKKISFIHIASNNKIEPLECDNCGGLLQLNLNQKACSQCNTKVKIPKGYEETIARRNELNILNKNSYKYLKAASFLQSHSLTYIFLFGFLLSLVAFIYLLFFSDVKLVKSIFYQLLHLEGKAGDDMMGYFFYSSIVWIVLFMILSSIHKTSSKRLKSFELPFNFKKTKEIHKCNNCASQYELKNNFLEVCVYCGTSNYNTEYIKNTHSAHYKTSIELLQNKMEFESELIALLKLPILFGIFIVILPYLLIFLPAFFRAYF
jgi:Zn finger protein HypA/HybF involved in hydrogenase expression